MKAKVGEGASNTGNLERDKGQGLAAIGRSKPTSNSNNLTLKGPLGVDPDGRLGTVGPAASNFSVSSNFDIDKSTA